MKILIFLLLLTSCASNLRIQVIPSYFYSSNKEMIDKSLKIISKNCRPKNKIVLNLKFDIMPQMLVDLNPNQIGHTSFYPDSTLIETNIHKYAYMNPQEQLVYFLHESGHVIGLEHVSSTDHVMHSFNTSLAEIKQFESEVYNHCSNIKDIPRKPNYRLN